MKDEALELALEALKELVAQTEARLFAVKHDHVALQNARETITAIKQALAAQRTWVGLGAEWANEELKEKTMDKDTALDLALEALEKCTTWHLTREQFDKNITAIKVIKLARALDKKAENARELGLDYEPVPENFMDALKFDVAMRDAAPVQEPDTYGYAKRLAEAIWEMHYKTIAVDWKPLPDLIGVLTQIDNMTSGLITPPVAQRQWVGLTVEEKNEITWGKTIYEILELFEAKLKDKNT